MPYKNIHWIKLEKRLLNDPRFFTLSEKAQLLYIKILLGLAEYGGKLALNGTKVDESGGNLKKSGGNLDESGNILRQMLRVNWTQSEFEIILKEVRNNFPKVLFHNGYITIKDFKNRHNWVSPKELPENSPAVPKEVIDKIIDKIRIRIDKDGSVPLTYFYKRYGKAVKELLTLSGQNPDLACRAIDWVADWCEAKGFTWGVETVIKHYFAGKAKNFSNEVKPQIRYE